MFFIVRVYARTIKNRRLLMSKKLDIINACLAAVGMKSVASEDSTHPSAIKAKESLERMDRKFQTEGWFFNEYQRTLVPQVGTGEVIVPVSAAVFAPDCPQYAVRGSRVYDTSTGLFNIGMPISGRLVEQIDIEDLPGVAATWLEEQAVYKFYLDEDGTEPKLSQYAGMAQIAFAKMEAEDLKHRRVNFFDRSSRFVRFAGLEYPGGGSV